MVVAFKLSGKFGTFSRSDSNSGGYLSYPVPPITAVRGLISALMGFSLEQDVNILDGIRIGIASIKLPTSTMVKFNSALSGSKNRMSNISFEVLIEPEYKIYVDLANLTQAYEFVELGNKLLDIERDTPEEVLYDIINLGIAYYMPYLGRNNYLADIETLDIYPVLIDDMDDFYEPETIIPETAIESSEHPSYKISHLSLWKNEGRRFRKFENFFWFQDGGKVKPRRVKGYSYYKIGDKLIICV